MENKNDIIKIEDRFCKVKNDKPYSHYRDKELIWLCHDCEVNGKVQKHYWQCTKEQAKRSGGRCSICERDKRPDTMSGYNDFKTMCPEFAANFISVDTENTSNTISKGTKIYNKQGDLVDKSLKSELTAEEIYYKSPMKCFWKCPVCGNTNSTQIRKLADVYKNIKEGKTTNNGCKHCQAIAGKGGICVEGHNDLSTKAPHLAKEFDSKLNNMEPSKVSWMSNKKYYWICKKHGSYKESPSNRIYFNKGCPKCNKNTTKDI